MYSLRGYRELTVLPIALLIASLLGCSGSGSTRATPHTGASAEISAQAVSPAQSGLLGDMDGDGEASVGDAIKILRIIVGLDPDDERADANQNGSTDVGDAIKVLRCVVGLDDWPIGDVATVTVNITTPADNAEIDQGTATNIRAEVTSTEDIDKVEFRIDGALVATRQGDEVATTATKVYVYLWQTAAVGLGEHAIAVKAYDKADLSHTGTATVNVTVVQPPTVPPTVEITAPAEGAQVSGNFDVTVEATPHEPGATIAKVDVSFAGTTKTVSGAAGAVTFNSAEAPDGVQTITAVATDSLGGTGTATVTVHSSSPAVTYEFVTTWGSRGSGDGEFAYPGGVAVSTTGHVYIADTDNHRIQKFSPTGQFISKWGAPPGSDDGQLKAPSGVAVDAEGNVYVGDTGNLRIQKFTSNGTFLTKWGSFGDGDGQFSLPGGVAVDPNGNVYVTDGPSHRIQKFTSNGTFLTKWGSFGDGDGQFNRPTGVAVDAAGNVYVADCDNQRIQKFSNSGAFLTKWGSPGPRDGQFQAAFGIAVDADENVYVADPYYERVQKFTSTGTFMTKWGSLGTGDGQFDDPKAVAVAPGGSVYVADSRNHRIQEFQPYVAP